MKSAAATSAAVIIFVLALVLITIVPNCLGPQVDGPKEPEGRAHWSPGDESEITVQDEGTRAKHADQDAQKTALHGSFSVQGQVISGSGDPVVGARVILGESDEPSVTGEEGVFRASAMSPGPALMRVVHPEFVSREVTVAVPSEGHRIVLERGLSVRGYVHFPDYRPVPGITVFAAGVGRYCQSGNDGRYVLSGLLPGEVVVQTGEADSIRAEAGDTGVDFEITTHVILLKGRDLQGEAVVNARYSARRESRTSNGSDVMAGDLDECGQAVLFARAGDTLSVEVGGPGWAKRLEEITLVGSPSLHELEIVLEETASPGVVDLQVNGDSGEPPDGVIVTLRSESGVPVEGFFRKPVKLNSEGRGRLEGIPPGKLSLEVTTTHPSFSVEGYGLPTQRRVTVESGRTVQHEILIRQGGRVRVTVTSTGGELVPPGTLRLVDENGERVKLRFIQFHAGAWGTGTSRPLPALLAAPVRPGGYTLWLDGHPGQVSREVAVRPGETSEVAIQVEK